MEHTWKCKECGAEYKSYCYEFYTSVRQKKIRRAQIEAELCSKCFDATWVEEEPSTK